jgi:hypothetical protein
MKQQQENFAIKDPSKYTMFKPVSFIKRGVTSTRCVLHYLKMKRGTPASALQVREMFPKRFKGPVEAGRILKTLESRGFAKSAYPGAWIITPRGIEAIGLLAQRDKLKHADALD